MHFCCLVGWHVTGVDRPASLTCAAGQARFYMPAVVAGRRARPCASGKSAAGFEERGCGSAWTCLPGLLARVTLAAAIEQRGEPNTLNSQTRSAFSALLAVDDPLDTAVIWNFSWKDVSTLDVLHSPNVVPALAADLAPAKLTLACKVLRAIAKTTDFFMARMMINDQRADYRCCRSYCGCCLVLLILLHT